MSQALMDELKRENLCTHFILPLLKLNKYSFISSNFVNSYLSPTGSQILVEIVDPNFLSRGIYRHLQYRGSYQGNNGHNLLCFELPKYWAEDVSKFMEGKFSQMSHKAKRTIIWYSKLPYKERDQEGRIVTDGRLAALEKHKVLKDMWEKELEPREEITGELLSIPGAESYIDLSTLTVL